MFLLILGFIVMARSDCDINFGFLVGKIDLSSLPQLTVDFSDCHSLYFKLMVDLCNNLNPEDCPSKISNPPGNACDGRVHDTAVYYWVGNANNRTHSVYNTKDRSFQLYYKGIPQVEEVVPYERNLWVNMNCGDDLSSTCAGVTIKGNSTTYNIDVTTPVACSLTPH